MSLIGEVYICKQFITSPIHIKLNSHGLTVVFPRFCFLITWEYHVKYVANPNHFEQGVSNFELKKLGGSYYIINSDDITSQNLCERFKEFPEFICLGITNDYEKGMNFILKFAPEVVFIDLDSYPKNEIGDVFSYCKEINEYIFRRPKYIALSKDISKAYQALKGKFYDYILKPGKELEIRKIILQLLKSEQYALNDTLCLKSYKDYTLLKVEEILFLKADNNATDFVMIEGKTISAFKTLKSFEKILPNSFIRIHHSYIINKKHISRINFGKLKCFLDHNKISLPFSRSYRHNLQIIEELLEQKAISFN